MGEDQGSHASGQEIGSPGKVPQIIMTQFSHISEGGDSEEEEEDEFDGINNIKPDYTEGEDELEIHEAFDDEDQESDDEVSISLDTGHMRLSFSGKGTGQTSVR